MWRVPFDNDGLSSIMAYGKAMIPMEVVYISIILIYIHTHILYSTICIYIYIDICWKLSVVSRDWFRAGRSVVSLKLKPLHGCWCRSEASLKNRLTFRRKFPLKVRSLQPEPLNNWSSLSKCGDIPISLLTLSLGIPNTTETAVLQRWGARCRWLIFCRNKSWVSKIIPQKNSRPINGHWIHPGKLTWNLKMNPWKRRFLSETIIFRFHVSFRGCKFLETFGKQGPQSGHWKKSASCLPELEQQAIDSFGNRYLLGVFENKDDARKAFDAWNKEYEQVPSVVDGYEGQGWWKSYWLVWRSWWWFVFLGGEVWIILFTACILVILVWSTFEQSCCKHVS